MQSSDSHSELRRRWQLMLGHYSQNELGAPSGQGSMNAADANRDRLLAYLYDREYHNRQYEGQRSGGRGASPMTAPEWLNEVRELFPRSSCEILQRQALERYGMQALLTDPAVLAQATPSMELVQTLISCRALLPDASLDAARWIIRQVIADIEKRLAQRVRNAITGARRRSGHGGQASLANLDWASTVRGNLKNYDRELNTLVLERLYFWQRQQRQMRWDIIVLVDQSGSMLDSVIHSAVLAAIFTGLQNLRTRLVLFDTQVVDVSDRIGDPVDVLLGIQLGGGTDIAQAVHYAASKIDNPRRTLVVLISDFYEGGNEQSLIAAIQKMYENGVKLLGLAALDDRAEPDYDRQLAQQLVQVGMDIGAMTPDQLADWVGLSIQ